MESEQAGTGTSPRREIFVNGVPIASDAIAAEVQNFPARAPGYAWRHAAEALVIRELLRQEVVRLGITAVPELDAAGRRETSEDAAIRTLLAQEVALPTADEETLRRFYERNVSKFMSSALYEAEHILVAAPSRDAETFEAARLKCEGIYRELVRDPSLFGNLARTHSDCPSAGVGGSLGQLQPGETTPEFEVALAALAEGETSPPVGTRYGWHIIHLSRRIDASALPFEAVRDQIKDYLEQHVTHHAYAQYMNLLIGRSDIQGLNVRGAPTPLMQ